MNNIHFNFKHVKATEALKEHLTSKAKKFEKYVTYTMEVHFFLSVEKTFQTAEITVYAEHRELVAVAKCKDLYESIDLAVHKIETQLKKEREKRKGHHAAHLAIRESSKKLAQDILAEVPHKEKRLSRKTR
jgi:putative sigma-54 modulation protein